MTIFSLLIAALIVFCLGVIFNSVDDRIVRTSRAMTAVFVLGAAVAVYAATLAAHLLAN